MCSRLMELAGRAVGLVAGLLLLGTLGTGVGMFIKCITLLLSVWGMGTLVVVCTLGTCYHCKVSVGVAVCSNRSGCAFICTCIASTIRCRSFVASGQRMSVFACHVSDGFDAISQCVHHFVGMCDGWIGDVFVLELHSVGQALLLVCFTWKLCVQ